MMPTSRRSQNARLTSLALAVGMTLAAGDAMAVRFFQGFGSSFAAPAYVGTLYIATTPNARQSQNGGSGQPGLHKKQSGASRTSILETFAGTYRRIRFSYCQSGVGFAKNALNVPTTGSCGDYSVAPEGLNAWSTRDHVLAPGYIVTESPYSTDDYNDFLAGPKASTGGVAQFPTIAGAVAFAHGDAVNNVALKNYQLCKIYSGVITHWSSIPGVTGGGKTGPITIVYNNTGGGATFALTSYLAKTCNGTTNVPAGFVFTPSQRFSDALPGGVHSVFGSRAVGAEADPGVVQAVLNTANPNALGYASTGEVVARAAGYATVNGFDPTQFGKVGGNPAPVVINPAQLLAGKVLDGLTPNDVPGSASTAIKNCMLLVDPSTTLRDTYPVFAVSYMDMYYSATRPASRGKQTLVHFFYNDAKRPVLPAGYAYLDGNSLFGKQVRDAATACVW